MKSYFKQHSLRLIFFFISIIFCLFYIIPPLSLYYNLELSTFDYGIFVNSTKMLSLGRSPYITTRGVHAFADNQDFLQLLFALFHYTNHPHQSILITHSLCIFAGGLICFFHLEHLGFVAILVSLIFWLSPFMINMNLDVVHTEALATSLLILLYINSANGRTKCFYLTLFLTLLCKEDTAVYTAFFLFLAFLGRGKINISLAKKHLLIGFFLSCLTFLINQKLILPYYILQTCNWLSTDFDPAKLPTHPINPWFDSFYADPLNLELYRTKLLDPQLGRYLLFLLWPLLFVGYYSYPISLMSFVGIAINAIAGDYLIKGIYHYDHSTFAGIIIAILIAIKKCKHRLYLGSLLLTISLFTHFQSPDVTYQPKNSS